MSNILSKDNKEVKTKKHQCSFCYGKGKKLVEIARVLVKLAKLNAVNVKVQEV